MELCTKEQCSGCLACYNACNHDAIQLVKNREGFIYPEIDSSKCIDCGLCSKSCPVLFPRNHSSEKKEAYAAWNKDYKVVRRSTSGGFFTTISRFVIHSGGVVYGAGFDENFNVQHQRVESEYKLQILVGSKYVQSNIGTTYRQVKQDLKESRLVLFTGTPCQIAGLYNFLGPRANESKLVTVDLVCHGVPSPLMFQEYKYMLETRFGSKLKSYCFRDKKWSWVRYNTKAIFENGKIYYGKWEEDCFMRGFLRDFFQRPSCHQCLYTNMNRPADFTIADFWGYIRQKGERRNLDKGINAILVNTKKAKDLYFQLKQDLVSYNRRPEQVENFNPALRDAFPIPDNRNKFWNDYFNNGFDYIVKKYLYPEPISDNFRFLYNYGPIAARLIQLFDMFAKRIKLKRNGK